MYDYSARISEISDIRSATRLECDRLRRSIGESFVDLADESDTMVAPILQEYRAIRNRMERSSSALERMIQIDERQTAIRMQMKELQKELEQKESGRGLEGSYEAVGAAAFRLFREHPLVDATYSSAFSAIAKYQDGIRRLDTRLQQLQSDPHVQDSSWLDKFSRGGRGLVLRNRRSVKENQLPGLLQKLGRELSTTDFFDTMEDAELNEAAEPLREAEARKGELRREIDALSTESRQLVEEFNALSGGSRLQKAQQHHEDEISTARNELNSVLLSLGSIAERTAPEQLKSELDKLASEEDRRAHFDLVLQRLQAGRQAELIDSEIGANETRQAAIDAQIADLREQKKRIGAESTEKASERDRLLSERGNETELFDT